jgi:hypothetical protein
MLSSPGKSFLHFLHHTSCTTLLGCTSLGGWNVVSVLVLLVQVDTEHHDDFVRWVENIQTQSIAKVNRSE